MKAINSQMVYWDSVARTKKFTMELDMDRFAQIASYESMILDYGCGSGRLTDDLFQHGYRQVSGVDFSAGMIEQGRKTYPHLNLSVVKNNRVEVEDQFFDIVILSAVLTSIPVIAEQEEVMKEICRILRPGGQVYMIDFFLQDDPRNQERYAYYLNKYGEYGVFENSTGGVVRHHRAEWLDSITRDFQKTDLFYKEHISSQGFTSKAFHYIGQKSKG